MNGIYRKAKLIQIMPVTAWHDQVIEDTCRRAIFATQTDPALIPKKHVDPAAVSRRVETYLTSINCDSRLSLPPPINFPDVPRLY